MSGGPSAYQRRKPLRHLLERLLGAEVGAGGGDLRDAQRHLGVVAPLAGRDAAEPAAEHLRLALERGAAELVRDAQGVTGGLPDQDADRPVGLLAVEVHAHHRLSCRHNDDNSHHRQGSSGASELLLPEAGGPCAEGHQQHALHGSDRPAAARPRRHAQPPRPGSRRHRSRSRGRRCCGRPPRPRARGTPCRRRPAAGRPADRGTAGRQRAPPSARSSCGRQA